MHSVSPLSVDGMYLPGRRPGTKPGRDKSGFLARIRASSTLLRSKPGMLALWSPGDICCFCAHIPSAHSRGTAGSRGDTEDTTNDWTMLAGGVTVSLTPHPSRSLQFLPCIWSLNLISSHYQLYNCGASSLLVRHLYRQLDPSPTL